MEIKIRLRPAVDADFYHLVEGRKVLNVGVRLWIKGVRGDLQQYMLREYSDLDGLKAFLDAGRVFVIAEDVF